MNLNTRIVNAIHDKNLADVVSATLNAGTDALTEAQLDMLRQADAACGRIRDLCSNACSLICNELDNAGIPYQIDDQELKTLQIHQFTVSIQAPNPTTALAIARRLGYRPADDLSGAMWEMFWRSNDSAVLTRKDDVTMRLRLRWPRARRPAWQAPFWPHLDDAAMVPLPAQLWWLTFALRPVAILARRFGAPSRKTSIGEFLGTPADLIPELLAFASVNGSDVVYDLGCGDGRILTEAAKRYGCRAVGYELDPSLCRIARDLASQEQVSHLVTIHNADAMAAGIGGANVVFLFQPPDTVSRLVPELLKQLSPAGRIVAHEQSRIQCDPAPVASRPLFSEAALTVAHLWKADPTPGA